MSEEEISTVPQNAFDDDEDDEDDVEKSGNAIDMTDKIKNLSTSDDREEKKAQRISNQSKWSSSGSIGNIDLKDEVVSGGRMVPGKREEEEAIGRKGSDGGGSRSHIPVAGRRAGLRTKLADEESGRVSNEASEENLLDDEARPAALHRSGWGLADDDATGGVLTKKAGRRKNESDQDNSHGSPLKKASYTVLNDNPDEVTVVIPDLADAENEDLTSQVAAAPSNKMNRILALRELDKELEAGSSLMINEAPHGIDLSLLIATLNHPDQLVEEDRHWDWSIVFNQVASDIQLDIEANEIAVCKIPAVDKPAIKSQ